MKSITPTQGGIYAVYIYCIFLLCGILFGPMITGIDRVIILVSAIIGPSIFAYTSIKALLITPSPDQDFLTLDEGIFFVLSPFITILCCYFFGFYIIKFYNLLKH